MNKKSIVVSCPIDTYSGYGARARDFVKALLQIGEYDIKVLSQRWGNTRYGYLDDHNEQQLKSTIINKLDFKPDVWVQITVPNEFQAVGQYNIGVTAGIETTICDASWIEGCNRMNLILTSSKHSKNVFESTVYKQEDKNTNQLIREIKLNTKVEVLLEGADLTKYYPTKVDTDSPVVQSLNEIKESFCFLFVGHWLKGDLGQDRKNVGYTIKTFLETFKNKFTDTPALILKTSFGGSSILDQRRVLTEIDNIKKSVRGKLPNIYLLHGDVTDQEMNQLYNHSKIKAMVSFTKGEGFGRPLLEFSLTGKPIIASGWSGQVDFLQPNMTSLVGGALTKVHPSAVQNNVILAESSWFTPNDEEVARAYKQVVKKYKEVLKASKQQAIFSKRNFSFEKMTTDLKVILDANVSSIPTLVKLNLPKL